MTGAGERAIRADRRASAILTIDLEALTSNYRLLGAHAGSASCGAAIKADGYGVGVDQVAHTLWQAGCRDFFVATIDEGLRLRSLLPMARVHVLGGVLSEAADEFVGPGLLPVLNSLDDVAVWRDLATRTGRRLPAALHLDTGMSRLGLPAGEFDRLAAEPALLEGIDVTLMMSHLACADTPEHPLNTRQLAAFRAAAGRLHPAGARLSLANSPGLFLGPDYHFDLVRPGAALYGVNPLPGRPNPLRQVVRLQGKILQLREVDTDTPVGYGASHRASRPSRLATVGVGYADGYLRSLSNRGSAVIGGRRIPIVGRVSMDLTIFDVSDVPPRELRPGALVDLIGPGHTIDELAAEAGTIGYEILTSLGARFARRYVPAGAAG